MLGNATNLPAGHVFTQGNQLSERPWARMRNTRVNGGLDNRPKFELDSLLPKHT